MIPVVNGINYFFGFNTLSSEKQKVAKLVTEGYYGQNSGKDYGILIESDFGITRPINAGPSRYISIKTDNPEK